MVGDHPVVGVGSDRRRRRRHQRVHKAPANPQAAALEERHWSLRLSNACQTGWMPKFKAALPTDLTPLFEPPRRV